MIEGELPQGIVMHDIHILEQSTIDKIAAGEVVERPQSVIKELIENAVDAGATRITVEIRDGGISRMRVTDNGRGISAEDIPLAFLRHATSKIASEKDLSGLKSLGFRGEALSSIAAVSRVELITKRPEDLTASRYLIEGGREKLFEEIGAPDGTTIVVRDIFYNTPARAKFLKTALTEAGHVGAYVEQLMLSNPGISFTFIVNGQTRLSSSGSGRLLDTIFSIYGKETARLAVPVSYEENGITVSGFAGKPQISRGNRNFENYYVNGRYVKSRVIAKGIEDAYGTKLMQHQYPFSCLMISLSGESVDVNVHPTKMEVRFSDEKAVYDAVRKGVRTALDGLEMIVSSPAEEDAEERKAAAKEQKPLQAFEVKAADHLMAESSLNAPVAGEPGRAATTQPDNLGDVKSIGCAEAAAAAQPDNCGDMKSIGCAEAAAAAQPDNLGDVKSSRCAEAAAMKQPDNFGEKKPGVYAEALKKLESSNNSFVRESQTEFGQGLHIRDEEASTKKGGEGQFVQRTFAPRFMSQEAKPLRRMVGQVFRTYWICEYEDKVFLFDQHAAHERVLFERFMEAYDKREITSQLLNPPIVVTLDASEESLLKMYGGAFSALGFDIENIGERDYALREVPYSLGTIGSAELFRELLDHLETASGLADLRTYVLKVATEACKAAVKGGEPISMREAEQLLDDLMKCSDPYHCPHGRPTIISFTEKDLEKRFKRIV